MAKANFVKSARKAIYVKGRKVEYVSQRGKKAGETLTKLDRTVPNEDGDEILINVGESYYHWSFKNGGTRYSKTPPKQSQLTQNPFYQTVYGWKEQLEEYSTSDPEDIGSMLEDLKSDVESLRDEFQEKMDNLEEYNLGETPSGEIVRERLEALEEYYDELDAVDTEYDGNTVDDVKEELLEEEKETQLGIIYDYEDCPEESVYEKEDHENALKIIGEIDDGSWEPDENELNERYQEQADEWISDKIEEIQGIELSV